MVLYPSQDSDANASSQQTTSPDGSNTMYSSMQSQNSKKFVHFADTIGLSLTCTFFYAKNKVSPPTYRKRITDTVHRNDIKKSKKTTRGQTAARLMNFRSPVSPANFSEGLSRNNVCLERIFCHDAGIYGKVKVKNLAYVKEVRVRFTFDSWETFRESHARYVSPGSNTAEEGTDTFRFHVKPPPPTAESRKIEFAILYKVKEEQFWDNNFGDNYRLVCLRG